MYYYCKNKTIEASVHDFQCKLNCIAYVSAKSCLLKITEHQTTCEVKKNEKSYYRYCPLSNWKRWLWNGTSFHLQE